MLIACFVSFSCILTLCGFGLWPEPLYPCNFSGKDTGAGCHILLLGIFQTQGSSVVSLASSDWQADSLPAEPSRLPKYLSMSLFREKWKYKFKPCLCCYDPVIIYSIRNKLSSGLSARRTWSAFLRKCYLLQQDWFLWPHWPCLQKKKSFLSLKFGFIPQS